MYLDCLNQSFGDTEQLIEKPKTKTPRPQSSGVQENQSDPEALNAHYRRFLNDDFSSPPPTPKETNVSETFANRQESVPAEAEANLLKGNQVRPPIRPQTDLDASSGDDHKTVTTAKAPLTQARSKVAKRKPVQRRSAREDALTAEELALDASSGDELMTIDAPVTQGLEADARMSALSWDKERYFLDHQELRDAATRQMAQELQRERKQFCEKLVLEGKTPEELEAFLRLVYPAEQA
ncbi:uncharacterized protein MELLADRAFT_110994 [Melampsora larici-populina 98AG31]|uniref:Uncharacterized protein n=1 Tax=Melampsora larici-populina (strain 98AG31 / pathotype 3-4-7) TaxID=747676 RepID=F4S1P4_MELLP|nr:uncharacterized protein MELLADRAFT_110994 [Melampsora larici-populina 98AG31]EGG01411.1 hypothetical protein MELLADRAFT_110994 [Melampsora larici-populina 98AG31]